MKKLFVFFGLTVILIMMLSFNIFSIRVNSEDDIESAICNAESGDEIYLTLGKDIDLTNTVKIEKNIKVSIAFNGYQIDYKGADTGFSLNSIGAELIINGSNPLDSYKNYSHYSDLVKPDIKGSSTLVTLTNGSLTIKNAYIYAPSDKHAIFSPYSDWANCKIEIFDSVLRTPQGSTHSAISAEGKSGGQFVTQKVITLNNCVEYGGFKGSTFSFNFTYKTEFTNVRFYDFKIYNDSWYNTQSSEVAEIMMNGYDKAAKFTGCTFLTYDGEPSNIEIVTYTGKQNIKLYQCEYKEIVGTFKADLGGNSAVYITKIPSTCEKEGEMLASILGNEFKKEIAPKIPHDYSNAKYTYPNGYAKEGLITGICKGCGAADNSAKKAEPIFVCLGYSINEREDSLTLGTRIDRYALEQFKLSNPDVSLEYGVFAGDLDLEVKIENGRVVTSGGIFYREEADTLCALDIRIRGISDDLKDEAFKMEFYISDGKTIEYADDSSYAMSFNEIKNKKDNPYKSEVEKLLSTKHKLYYNDDGSFRVLIIADAHMDASSSDTEKIQAVKDRIKTLVDKVEPNLVIFTGDNTISSSSETKLRNSLDALVSYIEQKQIPWCHTFGNHDHEGALSKEKQQQIHESYEYCVSKAGPEDIFGVGNYVLGVYNKDGSLGSAIYCLDSGAYATNGGYDYIKQNQIDWYKSTSELLEKYNGAKVPSIMAFHIPLTENHDAYNNRYDNTKVYETTGNKNENICSSNTDSALFETALARGDVKAIVTGHDHVNDYMYNYLGIKLCSSPNISDLTYTNSEIQGSRVFDLSLETIDDIPTYVEYILERVNGNNYSELESNVTIIDGESLPNIVKEGYDSSSYNGSINVELASGKGKDGSCAIAVSRDNQGNFEINFLLGENEYGKIGDNKYLVVWMDLTDVDFRKACFGVLTGGTTASPFRTDDYDRETDFYYLADGSSEWVTMSHGNDGCFGNAQNSSVRGLKGYFAFNIREMLSGGSQPGASTLLTGIYFYGDINNSNDFNKTFYIDDIKLVEDYRA